MSNRGTLPTRTVGDEILAFLAGRSTGRRISATAKYIATEIELPVRAVREELEKLALTRQVRARTIRSGDVLYRRPDHLDAAWDQHRGVAFTLTFSR